MKASKKNYKNTHKVGSKQKIDFNSSPNVNSPIVPTLQDVNKQGIEIRQVNKVSKSNKKRNRAKRAIISEEKSEENADANQDVVRQDLSSSHEEKQLSKVINSGKDNKENESTNQDMVKQELSPSHEEKQLSKVINSGKDNKENESTNQDMAKQELSPSHEEKQLSKTIISGEKSEENDSTNQDVNEIYEKNGFIKSEESHGVYPYKHFYEHGEIQSMTTKTPFSTFIEIENFLHPPIFGGTKQNTFDFIDSNNKEIPQLDTKLLNSVTYYNEQPYSHLVCFTANDYISLTSIDHIDSKNIGKGNDYHKAVGFPIHGSHSTEIGETNNTISSSYALINIKFPVIVGEYKLEICLEENVLFKEEVYKINEISKEVILTNCEFVPSCFSHLATNRLRQATKGKLFIKGYLQQNIEYIAVHKKNLKENQRNVKNTSHILNQKIVLELIIELLQVQKIQFGNETKKV